jgi:hypothetical protein
LNGVSISPQLAAQCALCNPDLSFCTGKKGLLQCTRNAPFRHPLL